MSRTIELDGDVVIIRFPFDRKVLDVVRSLPARRFHANEKYWYVPAQHMEQVIGRLMPHGFELGEALMVWLVEQEILVEDLERLARRAHKPFLDEERLPAGTWTVAKLNHEVQQILRDAFREELWIAAEIQSFDRNRRSGHAFFELVHRPYQGADPSARVHAVIWAPDREKIERALDEDGGGVRLRDGLMVRFMARADFYTGQGRYQLTVSDIDLAYTSGTIHQNRENILRELSSEGLIDLNVSKPLVDVPLRVALITSDGSDAYADFVDELRLSGYGFQVGFFAAKVQGAHAEQSILEALRYFAAHADHYDVLVIVRGGGARSDLAYFDTQAIGEAVCRHPLKIVVGVGHQRDQCLLDFIAHSEKTPTAAANAIVEQVVDYLERQYDVQDRILREAEHRIEQERARLSQQIEHALRVMDKTLDQVHRRLDRVALQVVSGVQEKLDKEQRGVERVMQKILQSASGLTRIASVRQGYLAERLTQSTRARVLGRQRASLERQQERLIRAATSRYTRASAALDLASERARLLDPKRVLERGYALIWRGEEVGESFVRHGEGLEVGESLTIQWADGTREVEVKSAQEREVE